MTFVGPVDPQILRTATTPEIALLLLPKLGDSPHAYNLMNGAGQQYHEEIDGKILLGRLSDAYAWLESHGCIGPVADTGGWRRVTQAGRELLESPNGLSRMYASERLHGALLPQLEASARPNFDRGDYETAAFAALKAVEVEVRQLGHLSADLVGTKLMQEAFRPGGPLNDPNAEGGEQVGIMDLFKGAIGTFKNPASHRSVEFDDPTEALEVIQLADLLLRILKRIEDRLERDADPTN